MRKTLLIISLVATIAVGANAQTRTDRVGIKVGPSFDWASAGSTAVHNEGFKLGGNVGLVYDHYLTANFAVSSGLSLNYLRMKYTFTDRRRVEDFLEETNVSVLRRLKTTNIEIPLKAKARFEIVDSFMAYAEAGVGLSINCQDFCKDSYTYYWVASEAEQYDDCINQYRVMQFSMVFGLGAEFEVNPNLSFFAQVTFDHCFSNAFVSSLEKQTGSIVRNNFIGIEVGVMH